jgi:hypothetical protein
VIGRQDYQWQHEPVLYGWKPGARTAGTAAAETTVIDDDVDLRALSKRELIKIVDGYRNAQNTDRASATTSRPPRTCTRR